MTLRPLSLKRTIALSAFASRNRSYDVMAKYRRSPVVTPTPSVELYETASTVPAGSSIQEVPPPDTAGTSGQGVRKAVPLPAMQPLSEPVKLEVKNMDKEIVVEGVVVPPKPRPPTDEECCMSGCVHCVYNIYADDLEQYTESLDLARKALVAAGRPESAWPESVRQVEKKGKEGMEEEETGKVADGMDPVMSAFLAMENVLKKKQVASRGSTVGAGAG